MASEIVVARPEVNPLMILQQAVEKGASIEQLTALMGLSERWEMNQAKKAFREAMAEFSKSLPKIEKNQHVKFQTSKGITEYDHATLDNVTEQIVKGLSTVGISHTHKVSQVGTSITVTCVLSMGVYSEETSITALADESGGKNAIQAVVSTTTYLRRHTILAATGCATGMEDNDGAGIITADDNEVIKAITEAKTMEELKPMYQAAIKQATAARNVTLVSLLTKAKDDRKRVLSNA